MNTKSNLNKIYLCLVFLFLFTIIFTPIYNSSDNENVHTYKCNGNNNLAYKSGINYDSNPNDKTEFSSYEYSIISSNNSDCLYHEIPNSVPSHIFNFSIEEDVSDISQVKIFWRGYGGATSTRREGFNIVITSHFGCNLRIFNNTIAGTSASEPKDISVLINDNFGDIIKNGHLELVAASNFRAGLNPGGIMMDKSFLYSCYVEIKIFYDVEDNTNNDEELIINAQNKIEEETNFEVTVNSNSQPVNNVEISFNNSQYYTNEQGKVTLKAPKVEQDSIYTIEASKTGYLSNTKSIEIQNIEEEIPVLELISDSTVYENESFIIEVISEGSPVENALINFDNKEYLSDQNGKAVLSAPLVDVDSDFVVNVSKSGFVSVEKVVSVLDNGSSEDGGEGVLVVDCVSSVLEGSVFDVFVSCDGEGVGFVYVLFAGDSFVTDGSGFLSLSAPLVDVDSDFVVNVSESGYSSTEKIIKVENEEKKTYYGKLKGVIRNQTGILITDVKICIFNNSGWCTYTNKNGLFDFTIPIGSYYLESEKEGFEKKSFSINVEKNITKWINLTLIENGGYIQGLEKTDNQIFFEYIKDDQIKKGLAGAELSNREEKIFYYSEKLVVEIFDSSDKSFKFSVSAEKNTSRKLIFVEMTFDNYSSLKDLKYISISYDGKEIERRGIDYMINTKENNPAYTYLESTDDNGKPVFLIAILIPSFSEHVIEIKPVIEYYNSFGFIVLYLSICIIASIVFVGSVILRKRF